MNLFQVILLSLIQGITEFLPISSSGHLVIFQKIFGLKEAPIFFDIILHLGSLLAILFYFKDRISKLISGFIKKEPESLSIFKLLVVGTIPAVIAGVLFENKIEAAFNSLKAVGFGLIITSLFLFSTRFVKKQNRQLSQLKWLDALIVGIFQAVAIVPGISRSGSTIVSGLWRGLSFQTAFAFSFYLAIPAILGAVIFKVKDIAVYSTNDFLFGVIGMLISAIVGFIALGFLENILKQSKFVWLGIYCLLVGLVIILK
jgi:undecaprenyl-diphosphatase